MKPTFLPLITCAALLVGTAASAATLSLSGAFSNTTPVPGLGAVNTSFSKTIQVDDALLAQNFVPDFSIDLTAPFSIGTTQFQSGIRVQVASNSVFGLLVNLNGVADGTTNLTFGTDDFRVSGSAPGVKLLDVVDAPVTFGWSSLVFSLATQDSFSQVGLVGDVTLGITDYTAPVQAVPLPASSLALLSGLLGLVALRPRKRP
ncbi:MAG: hypothetical protein AAFR93_05375 [Pseudomonadota bacterium]